MPSRANEPVQPPDTGQPPTIEQTTAIAAAGQQAAATGGNPAQAMQDEAARQGIVMSDEEAESFAELLAGKLSEKLIAGFEQRGAFEPPPEPVIPPPAAPPMPGESAQPAPTIAETQQPAPKSFAEKYFSR